MDDGDIQMIWNYPSITGPSGAAILALTADEQVMQSMSYLLIVALSMRSSKRNCTINITVYTFTADETVTWSLEEVNDKEKFAIDETTGALSFVDAPDYETPESATSDNAYKVAVVATDNAGNTSGQTVTVNVTDIDEIAPLITGATRDADLFIS